MGSKKADADVIRAALEHAKYHNERAAKILASSYESLGDERELYSRHITASIEALIAAVEELPWK